MRVASFRSKGRIPACIWKHPRNDATLSRSSQPLVGMKRAKCVEDLYLLDQILATNPSSKILYISDSRPKVNAQANALKGMGYELTPSVYTNCMLEFNNIANIHVMRDSLNKLAKALKKAH